jgi:hypothetical protein
MGWKWLLLLGAGLMVAADVPKTQQVTASRLYHDGRRTGARNSRRRIGAGGGPVPGGGGPVRRRTGAREEDRCQEQNP